MSKIPFCSRRIWHFAAALTLLVLSALFLINQARVAIHPQLLAQQLSAGEAIRLSQCSLFEAAATRALRESDAQGDSE